MLGVILLSVIMLSACQEPPSDWQGKLQYEKCHFFPSVVMLNVIMPSVIFPSVAAPFRHR
jgi:hypothetical protein